MLQSSWVNASRFFSLVKFSHTLFAFPFAWIGLLLGISSNNNQFEWTILLFVGLAFTALRNFAMSFNRYLDQKIDAENPRTKNRELPSGLLNKQSVIGFMIVNLLIFFGSAYFINSLCLILSPVPVLLTIFYSYTKRFTALCHFVLGLCLALAPVGAALAAYPVLLSSSILLAFIVIFWVSGFDVIYALQDFNFDVEYHLHAIPSRFGIVKSMYIARLLHLIVVILLLVLGFSFHFWSWGYWTGCSIFIVLLFFQHYVVAKYKLQKINTAFFTLNGIASVLFAIFCSMDLL